MEAARKAGAIVNVVSDLHYLISKYSKISGEFKLDG